MITAQEEHQTLVHNIETLRKDKGLTKKHIYEAANISQRSYDRRIEGQIDFRFYEIADIAEALDTTVEDLIAKGQP